MRRNSVDRNKRCRIACLQKSPVLVIVLLRIDAGGLQHILQVVAVGQSTLDNQIDMSAHEVVGMAVVRTEHHHIWALLNQRTQQLIVFCGTIILLSMCT